VESLKTYFNGFESKYDYLEVMMMELKFLKLFSWTVVLTLLIFMEQYNTAVQASQEVLYLPKIDTNKVEEIVIHGEEGVEFTTLVPQEPVKMPKEGELIPIRLGLRITNNSSVEREFLQVPGLPNFLGINQQKEIKHIFASSITAGISPERFGKLLKPKESIDILEDAYLTQENGQTLIFYRTALAIGCNFVGFTPGEYQVIMRYEGFDAKAWNNKKNWHKTVQAIPGVLKISK
jgi:hypothetical protein